MTVTLTAGAGESESDASLSRNLSMHAYGIPRILHGGTSPAGRSRHAERAIALLLMATAWACGDSTTAASTKPHPVILRPTSDTVQTGVVGTFAGSNPSVIVLDQDGAPLAGVRVEFSSAGLPGGFVDTITSADGKAATSWKLATNSGKQILTATIRTARVPSVTFTAIAAAGPAASLVSQIPLVQVGNPSAPVPLPPAVAVIDSFGNAKPGVELTFEVTGGDGTVSPATVVTDDKGVATVERWTVGSDPGDYVLTVHAKALRAISLTARVNRPFFASRVTAGSRHSCLIDQQGQTYCWGMNDRAQINGDGYWFTLPTRIMSEHRFISLASGWAHNCAISDEVPSQAYCWGDNGFGQTGLENGGGVVRTPVKVPVDVGLTQVVTGDSHSCGLTADGQALCWGDNSLGQLGDGTAAGRSRPGPVVTDKRFTSLAAGAQHTCGLTADGLMYCWGSNTHHELGSDTSPACETQYMYYDRVIIDYIQCALRPQLTPGPRFIAIAAGFGTCGLTPTSEVDCFGIGSAMVPVSRGVLFAQLSAGGNCGLGTDAMEYCWSVPGSAPGSALIATGNGLMFRSIAGGVEHQCGILKTDDSVVCWGRNDEGQLGNGTTVNSSVPLRVAPPANP